jgi:hypothetical protein
MLSLFPHGVFPHYLTLNEIDDYLLNVWDSTHEGSPFERFIHWYQILEYAAFYYNSEEILSQIRRTLRIPGALSDVDTLSQKVRDIMVQDKAGDDEKFTAVIGRAVDPKVLWSEIDRDRDFFSSPTIFQGDLTIDSIITSTSEFKEFEKGWTKTLPEAFRNIRNALVHARHRVQAHTLHPTTENERKLAPWLNLISLTAIQQISFKGK